MNLSNKWPALLITLLVVLALMLLAAGINTVEFQRGSGTLPFFLATPDAQAPEATTITTTPNETVVRALVILLWMVSTIGLISVLLTRQGWKVLPAALVQALFLAGMYFLLFRFIQLLANVFQNNPLTSPDAQPLQLGDPPPALMFVSALLLAVLIIAALRWLFLRLPRPRRELDLFAGSLDDAIQQLDAGADLSDVVIDCYRTMLQIVQDHRGVKRQIQVTAREFEQRLVELGLPPADVSRLTSLFEQVRYGNQRATERQRREARDCLLAIANACQPVASPTAA